MHSKLSLNEYYIVLCCISIYRKQKLSDYQFRFRKHHPTSLALIDVDSIYSHLDLDEIITVIYVNLCKAFDTVYHDVYRYIIITCIIIEYVVVCSFGLFVQQFVSVSNAESKKYRSLWCASRFCPGNTVIYYLCQ